MSTEPTIREICEEFRRLDKEATPAPWDNEGHTWLYAKVPNGRPNGEGIATFLYEPTFGLTRTKSTVNAELAKHVRNHFPTLVAEVERLQGENEKEPQPDSVCVESDGCPTENAVLKREWRRLQKRVEELENKRNKKYVVVTVTEGGADFSEYEDPGQLTSQWLSRDQLEEVRSELRKAGIGDVVTIDGCGTCFIANASDARAQKGEQ